MVEFHIEMRVGFCDGGRVQVYGRGPRGFGFRIVVVVHFRDSIKFQARIEVGLKSGVSVCIEDYGWCQVSKPTSRSFFGTMLGFGVGVDFLEHEYGFGVRVDFSKHGSRFRKVK
ncbi:hypothetical protein TIFTF001_036489 [Ficus carica]|uniref:Uncharacterized protein n=1 Tax=Ficus carica TaxID=3494 RepID=A0AA88JAT4_FICCA|nr:hypothetical protein TIFTF001_036489 [Ficus carica]